MVNASLTTPEIRVHPEQTTTAAPRAAPPPPRRLPPRRPPPRAAAAPPAAAPPAAAPPPPRHCRRAARRRAAASAAHRFRAESGVTCIGQRLCSAAGGPTQREGDSDMMPTTMTIWMATLILLPIVLRRISNMPTMLCSRASAAQLPYKWEHALDDATILSPTPRPASGWFTGWLLSATVLARSTTSMPCARYLAWTNNRLWLPHLPGNRADGKDDTATGSI